MRSHFQLETVTYAMPILVEQPIDKYDSDVAQLIVIVGGGVTCFNDRGKKLVRICRRSVQMPVPTYCIPHPIRVVTHGVVAPS